MGSRPRRSLIALVAAGALLGALATAGFAADPVEQRVDASVRYLQAVQNADGGFGGSPGAESDPIFTSWAALALAAAGINPRDQALPGGRSAIAYLRATAGRLSATTDFERTLMVITASSMRPRDFGGQDLVERILERQRPDGSFAQAPGGAATVNATAFAILSLAQVGETGLEGPIQRAATWLEGAADETGGYSWVPNAPGDADMTAAVIQALRAAGRAGTDAERRALEYLRTLHNDDGGFAALPGAESNGPSTAWTLQALWAAGEDPKNWVKAGGTPLDFLASMQQPDGSVRQSASSDPNRVWVTAYAVPALAGRPLPIEPVARAPRRSEAGDERPDRRPEKAQGPTPEDLDTRGADRGGQGGAADAPDSGAVYGGTGAGAPLYSAPRADGGGDRDPASAPQGGTGQGGGRSRDGGASGGGDEAWQAGGDGPRSARDAHTTQSTADEVEGAVVSAGAPGSERVRAERLRTAGGDDRPPGGLVVLGGIGLLAVGGALVEGRRP